MRWTVRLSIALAVLLASNGAARAKEIEGVRFAPEREAGGVRLILNNAGLLRYKLVIKAYVAALYLGEGVTPEQALADVPKRLEVEYFWNLKGADFGPATIDGMARNVDAATLARLRPRIERFASLFDNVQPGDRYALTYVPGLGTELSRNGRPKGTIEGADFAAALFSIWIGRRPLDDNLKDALLARQ